MAGSAGADGDNEGLLFVREPGGTGGKFHQHLPVGQAVMQLASLAFFGIHDGSCRHGRQCRLALDQRIALGEQAGKGVGILEDQRLVMAQGFAAR